MLCVKNSSKKSLSFFLLFWYSNREWAQEGKIFSQLHHLIMNQNRFHEPTMYL
jgi:hypothetical protein